MIYGRTEAGVWYLTHVELATVRLKLLELSERATGEHCALEGGLPVGTLAEALGTSISREIAAIPAGSSLALPAELSTEFLWLLEQYGRLPSICRRPDRIPWVGLGIIFGTAAVTGAFLWRR